MSDWLEALAAPTIAIALASVMIQGIKAAADLISQMRGRKTSRELRQIAYVNALLQLTHSLPMDEGRKAALKLELARTLLPGDLPPPLGQAHDISLQGKDALAENWDSYEATL